MSKKVVVTGCAGLVGSEVCSYLDTLGYEIHGVDNNHRAAYFGTSGDTNWKLDELLENLTNFSHYNLNICDYNAVNTLIKNIEPDVCIHAAAQPSHDLAGEVPIMDFQVNANGTLNVLESIRLYNPECIFVYMSTNKVYGDRPNELELTEHETRYDFTCDIEGITESTPIDNCMHSIFGVSKTAADLMVQEYGRYFNMTTCCLRAGCITGNSHSGVELHGFLNYLTKTHKRGEEYIIHGHKGKQVRDNIHAYDVARFISMFIDKPVNDAVYNIGGGKSNSCSILEAIELCESVTGKKQLYKYSDESRLGDHVCYYSDLSKIKSHYPQWEISKNLDSIFENLLCY